MDEKKPAATARTVLVDDLAIPDSDNLACKYGLPRADRRNARRCANRAAGASDRILMDIAMLQWMAWESTRRIREHADLQTVPIVAITAFDTSGFRQAA